RAAGDLRATLRRAGRGYRCHQRGTGERAVAAAAAGGPAPSAVRQRHRRDALVGYHAPGRGNRDAGGEPSAQRFPAGRARHGPDGAGTAVRLLRACVERTARDGEGSRHPRGAARILSGSGSGPRGYARFRLDRAQPEAGARAGLPVARDRHDVRLSRAAVRRCGHRAGRVARRADVSSGTGAATAPAVPHRLGHRAISLGAANAIDYAIQFLLPVVPVRYLTPEAFGSYRLLRLVAGTVMAVVTQAMAAGPFYFLPRSGDEEKRLYINRPVLLAYGPRYRGLKAPLLRRRAFSRPLRRAAPFAFAGALYGLRAQADQWLAPALFSVRMFASFSIAALLSPLVHVCRVSVQQAFLPSISRLEAAGDLRGMLELNSRGSVLAATLLYPM